jgi:hypothetical protein
MHNKEAFIPLAHPISLSIAWMGPENAWRLFPEFAGPPVDRQKSACCVRA